MAVPAHLDGLIDLLVEAMVREIQSTNENAQGAGKHSLSVLELNHVDDTATQD